MVLSVRDKRGISLIISYVLLISIAMALSIMVYSWLRFYVNPGEEASCPDGIDLIIQDYECLNDGFSLTVKNKGLRSISGFKVSVSEREGANFGIYTADGEGISMLPGDSLQKDMSYEDIIENSVDGISLIEINPFVLEGNEKVYCEREASRQTVSCLKSTSLRDVNSSIDWIEPVEDGGNVVEDEEEDEEDEEEIELPALENLVLHLGFDDADDFSDKSGNENDGTKQGTIWIAEGVNGGSRSFDGVDDYIDFGTESPLEGLDELTFSTWIKPESLTTSGTVVRQFGSDATDRAFSVTTQDGVSAETFDTIRIGIFDEAGSGIYNLETDNSVLSAGQWIHVTYTWEGGRTGKIYVGGIEVSSGIADDNPDYNSSIANIGNSDASFSIGAHIERSQLFFNGSIDEVRIYNKALNSTEIQTIYDVESANLTEI